MDYSELKKLIHEHHKTMVLLTRAEFVPMFQRLILLGGHRGPENHSFIFPQCLDELLTKAEESAANSDYRRLQLKLEQWPHQEGGK